ncbi:DUF4270 domain-containing protein [Flavobacterium phragmitis]|uniref:DUF4270 domain-containing protein n=1 Tax=Flavobacterium phragmitis TaxID=739143 RepID=A0A1I1JKL6_9FLAO|nr:DUF4270 domain-containing protein [Flavobacterium phragmitis]SFC49097.1 protein of unknown function [Flavobacterium phragmitis]
MYNTSFIKKILLALIVVFLYSCDKDFNAIGDGIVGDDHFGLEPEEYNVLAFNQEVTPVQSNNIAINPLGIFDNPLFGSTTANFVTQLGLKEYAPTIGESPEIQSVQLTIPYFTKDKTTDAEGNSTYKLDSIYGGQGNEYKLKLSVYESTMQMRNTYFSGGSQLFQYYYTDQDNDFFSIANKSVLLNDGAASENEQFFFDASEIRVETTDDQGVKTTTRTAPQMTLNLNKQFFQDKILKAVASKLSTEDLFQEYFRGLYFKVEKSGSSPSNMALLNFAEGKITIKYKAKTASTTDDANATEDKELVVLLKTGVSGGIVNTASFLQNTRNADYESAITNVNKTEGDERLYLKGGQGSVAVVKLFDQTDVISYDANGVVQSGANQVPDQLDEIRNNVKYKNWKVNEANLVFYIDADKMANTKEPQRVYLYDLTNNIVLADYATEDVTLNGLITLDSNKKGKYYKMRITSHIRNLIKDATLKNVNLGLAVSLSSGVTASNVLKNKVLLKDNADPKLVEYFSQTPRTSVMSPLGTVLYGGKTSAGDKRLKLQVYYTKPN